MLVVVVLLATVLMRLAIVTAVAYLLLPRGPVCPHCGDEMLPIRNRLVDGMLPLLQRRWCLECGWNGIVRRSLPAAARSETPRPASRTNPP